MVVLSRAGRASLNDAHGRRRGGQRQKAEQGISPTLMSKDDGRQIGVRLVVAEDLHGQPALGLGSLGRMNDEGPVDARRSVGKAGGEGTGRGSVDTVHLLWHCEQRIRTAAMCRSLCLRLVPDCSSSGTDLHPAHIRKAVCQSCYSGCAEASPRLAQIYMCAFTQISWCLGRAEKVRTSGDRWPDVSHCTRRT
ncbi:hypothetical protein BD413DRAFT_54910 [Trametes elegans]|nr:hypothetical protein BD413DRAFT_54910 [Trametes elegans]